MAPLHSSKPSRILLSMIAFSSLFSGTAFSDSIDLNAQRDLYDQAQEWLDDKNVSKFEKARPKLASYPLTPYLDYRAFLIDIGDKPPITVRVFIDGHKDFPFSGRISAPYLDALAEQKKWSTLLQFQTSEPNGETYQCHYYNAHLQVGKREKAFGGAKKLWMSGASISDACDPLFKAWEKSGELTDELVFKRMLLAFDGRNRGLLVYLSKKLSSSQYKDKGKAMLALYDKPETVVSFAQKYSDPMSVEQAQFALEKLARADSEKAQALVDKVTKRPAWTSQQKAQIEQFIALRLMDAEDEKLIRWRDKVIAMGDNVTLTESRIRLALRKADWTQVLFWINRLPEEEIKSQRWQYWLGRSEIENGHTEQGMQRLFALVGQRNFYSVAAAKIVKQSIRYPKSTVEFDFNQVKPYQKSLVRIQELIERDKIAAAKSEWNWLLDKVNQSEKEMLAAYASRQNWHHLTVTASISASLWDNLQLRFPVAHQWWFNFYGNKHGIDPIMLMSLARQESAMDSEARSPVGARGIMQIMPATAKYTAKKYQLTYSGADDLYEVGKNIEIGSHYLNGLLEQYDNNRIFAFAAYNAGPQRVNRWREQTQGKLDAYAFIEAIPFSETRGYVQNILMFETYYRDLMGQQGDFLNENELKTKY
ncbi:murein transglycosylase [Vibrio plantisponsor]|uniref:Murein transglycosylase n=1 Tax=Vibrio plantisponsor TaxID=664643 RepID=A0ABU4IEG3_9VIBR|nr:murein transglycosylase [Vibrio plantisponsor]MDW6016217.1 murein transglycosylase [Vibrio plantisponsor]NNM41151.1 murein transglycosylase [Vibrio plantisponsor]PNH88970.1 murein transglycosylase [Vibrio diazotrophicus]